MDYFLTRRPVFYDSGALFAYEMKYKRLAGTENAGANREGFFGIDIRRVCGGAKAFVNFSREMIKDGAPLGFPSERLIAVISGRDISDDKDALEICRVIKRKGYLFAINDFKRGRGFDEILELCGVVMLDFASPKTAESEASYICKFSNKEIFARNVMTYEDFEFAKRIGCKYISGEFFLKPQRDLRNIRPLPISIVKAMKIIMKPEPNVDEIVDVLSQDTAVCQKILRLINSAYFGVTNKISSIGQAIIVLGLDYLREWIYMLAIQHISNSENSELMRLSLVTAKFCRMIAREIPEQKNSAEEFYLMGLMSILAFGRNKIRIPELEDLPLTDEIKGGILRKDGVYGDVFGMAADYAEGRWESFEELAHKYMIKPEKASEMFAEAIEEADKTDFE